MPKLLIQTANGTRFPATLKLPCTAIGRAPSNDLALDDEQLSRFHAFIHIEGAFVTIEDRSSRNGVFVNGKRVDRQALASGDLLTLGSCKILFLDENQNYVQVDSAPLPLHAGPRIDPAALDAARNRPIKR